MRTIPEQGIAVELGLPNFVEIFQSHIKEEFATYSDDKLHKEISSMLRRYKPKGIFQLKTQKMQLGNFEEYKTWIHSETQDVLSSFSSDRETSRNSLLSAILESFGIYRKYQE